MCVGEENKRLKKESMRAIQRAYIDEKDIRVSFKLMGGGTTNDGELKFRFYNINLHLVLY